MIKRASRRAKPSTDIEKIDALWIELAGFPLWANGLKALENYIELLDFAAVEEAVIIAAERPDSRFDRWRYCCGILRAKLAAKFEGGSESRQR